MYKKLKVLKVYRYVSSGKLIASLGEGSKVIPLNSDLTFSSQGVHRVRRSTNLDVTPYRIEVEIVRDGDYETFQKLRLWNNDHLPKKNTNPNAPLEERIDISPSEQFSEDEKKYIGARDGGFGIGVMVWGFISFWFSGVWGWIPPVIMIITGITIAKLTTTPGDPEKIEEVKNAKERLRARTEKKLREVMQDVCAWASIDGVSFENWVSKIFQDQGYKVEHTPRSNDKGVDLILKKEDRTIIVQCKAYNKNVGVTAVRELQGVKHLWPDASEFMLVVLYGFSKPAKDFAELSNIKLYSIAQDYLKTDYRLG